MGPHRQEFAENAVISLNASINVVDSSVGRVRSNRRFIHLLPEGLISVATIPCTSADLASPTVELLLRVDSAIKRNPHLNGHQVFCQEESGVVVLHGRVSTFFQKQMAQESLKKLEGVEKVINQLQVDWQSTVPC
ncbi:MAG: BON domain-containing protein [Pirellulaceae bacterium]|nr:BON domain-containing protein [Pirellulaceae bacterium]